MSQQEFKFQNFLICSALRYRVSNRRTMLTFYYNVKYNAISDFNCNLILNVYVEKSRAY